MILATNKRAFWAIGKVCKCCGGCIQSVPWESLGFRVPPCLNTETYTHPFEDKPHVSHPMLVSKDTVQKKSRTRRLCVPACLLPRLLFSSLRLLASLPFKFLLKSLFPKSGLIRFSGLRLNSLPSVQFLQGRKSLSIKGDEDIFSPTVTPSLGAQMWQHVLLRTAVPSPGGVAHTVKGSWKGDTLVWCGQGHLRNFRYKVSELPRGGGLCFCFRAHCRSCPYCAIPAPHLVTLLEVSQSPGW